MVVNRVGVATFLMTGLVVSGVAAAGGRADAPQRGAPQAVVPVLVISEVMYDPSHVADSLGEWFEVYNPTNETYDLNGIQVTDTSGAVSFTINSTLSIGPGQYKVIAKQANLGSDAYGKTADFAWSTTGVNYTLANTVDSIVLKNASGVAVSLIYNDTAYGTWPTGTVGKAIQVDSTLLKPSYNQMANVWCVSTTALGTTVDRGTPGAANVNCTASDLDNDTYWATDDCDDQDATTHVGAVEVPTDEADNDCDGIDLYQIVADPGTDSVFGVKNELTSFAVGWDETTLAFAWDYTLETNAMVWYFDAGLAGGENNFLGSAGYNGAFPTDVTLGGTVDFMAASYGAQPLFLYKVTNNTSSDVTPQASTALRTSYATDGRAGIAYVKIPWQSIYALGTGRVAEGAVLRIAGLIRATDNQPPADIAPNNQGSTINTFAEVSVDLDEDGVADLGMFVDADDDGWSILDGDCDDQDEAVYPGRDETCNGVDDNCNGVWDEGVQNTYYLDSDRDGYGDSTKPVQSCQPLPSVATIGGDCDDNDAARFPTNPEICDGKDNNCEGGVDEGAGPIWFVDADEDTFRVDEGGVQACPGSQPAGTVESTAGIDCDDTDPLINPDGTEICDGDDNDCDGLTDDASAADASLWYTDADEDGFGAVDQTLLACAQPDGYVAVADDCDDNNGAASPALDEVCGDATDNNCDGGIDEDAAVDAPTWYADSDSDGWGAEEDSHVSCVAPEGYVDRFGDCDDSRDNVSPEADEVCDTFDNDCDGGADNNATDGTLYYPDGDGDAYGEGEPVVACTPIEGYALQGGDCDDADFFVNPGAAEIPNNNVDENCDGLFPGGNTPTPGTPTPDVGTPTPTPGLTPEPTPTPTATERPDTETPGTPPAPTPTPTDAVTPTPTATPTVVEPTPTASATAPTEPPTGTPTEPPTEAPTATDPAQTPTGTAGGGGCGGCDQGAGGGDAAGWMGLLALGLVARRRRAA